MEARNVHLLKLLELPDRYEDLEARVGPEVARLLIAPQQQTSEAFEIAALSIKSRGEGLFVPLYGRSGTGKTTLASNLSAFYPTSFAPSIKYSGQVTYDDLNTVMSEAIARLPANDTRIVPINLDHRESDPPSSRELAAIKRFLRKPSLGHRSIVLWPETDLSRAQDIARGYTDIAGRMPIELPLIAFGPPQTTWQDIAINTFEIVNNVPSIEDLGVNPKDYEPRAFDTIGDYLRQISNDFTRRRHELIRSTQKTITLVVVFVSASPDAGVLSQVTSSTYYGLVDGNALIDATKGSVIGRWWQNHRGLLTQTILRLNAHAFCLPPTASVDALRNFGAIEIQDDLNELGIRKPGAGQLARDFSRTDIGKYLLGRSQSAFESRGTPAQTSTPAFAAVAEKGFTYGKDKSLNATMRDTWEEFCRTSGIPFDEVTSEKKLEFCPLIPDNAIYSGDEVLCLEYTWRSTDYLISRHRSDIAQYILTKLKNYARELGWYVE